jgi:hypothetical protein
MAITRIAQGNLSNAKSAGIGVQEYRIDFGPGYRIYFGRDGASIDSLFEQRFAEAGGLFAKERRAAIESPGGLGFPTMIRQLDHVGI